MFPQSVHVTVEGSYGIYNLTITKKEIKRIYGLLFLQLCRIHQTVGVSCE